MNITDKITITNECNMELMKRYPDNYFDLAIVDPPYFSGPEKRKYYGNEINKLNIKRIDYKPLTNSWELPTEEYFNELSRVSKNQIIWGCNYYAKHIPSTGRIVWDKVNGNSSFSDAEIASSSFHNSVRLFSYMWNGMMQGSGFDGKMNGNKKNNEKRIHPTQKPVALYKWILDKYAKIKCNHKHSESERHLCTDCNNSNVKILDTHLGSGSIAIACHDYGFQLVACELDKEYFDKSVKRLQLHIGQQKLF